MSSAAILCVGLAGFTGHLIEVHADLTPGRPALVLTGLPDTAVHETRDRARAALINSGLTWANRRITINLLPAALPKHGSAFDAAIAAAILTAAGELPSGALDGVAVIGELGLDGALRPVRGVLPMVTAAGRAGVTTVIVPVLNAREAALVSGVTVYAVDSLRRLVEFVQGTGAPLDVPPVPAARRISPLDFADVSGQQWGRYGLLVAAAGGHHLALLGAPGTGTTVLAERLPAIMPALDDDEALEVTALHSLAGVLPEDGQLIRRPPWQAPHYSISMAAMLGGGRGPARPGVVSLAHRGVLFLDQVTEMPGAILQALRQPVETGRVVLARAYGTVEFPAKAQLVVAATPCPCTSSAADRSCVCTPAARRRHLTRLSGPLFDRIDIRITLDLRPAADQITNPPPAGSAETAERVERARQAAAQRWSTSGFRRNADVPGSLLTRTPWRLAPADTAELRAAVDRGLLTARGYHAVLRLAWTIADLEGRDRPRHAQVGEAIQLRNGWHEQHPAR